MAVVTVIVTAMVVIEAKEREKTAYPIKRSKICPNAAFLI